MDKAIKNLVEKGILLKNPITMVTLTLARSIEADKNMRMSELKPGYRGDIIILDKNTLDVKYTIRSIVKYMETNVPQYLITGDVMKTTKRQHTQGQVNT